MWPIWREDLSFRVNFNSIYATVHPSYSLTFRDESASLPCRTLGETELGNRGGAGSITKLDLNAINGSAPCGSQSVPAGVLKARVIAHEAGHKLGLRHTNRLTYWDPAISTANISGLAVDRFAHESTPDFLYMRLAWAVGVLLDQPGAGRGALAGIRQDWIQASDPPPGHLYQHTPNDRVTSFSIPDSIIDLTQPVFVEIQSGFITDWTPAPITALDLWCLATGDLLQLCIKEHCP